MKVCSKLTRFAHRSFSSKPDQPLPKIENCLYSMLGVPKNATKQDIKAAYLAKAREFHPDRRPNCDETLKYFTHVTKAYEVLQDEHKRAVYDDDSIPDEEYFTVTIAGVKINMFIVFSLVAVSAGSFGIYKYT